MRLDREREIQRMGSEHMVVVVETTIFSDQPHKLRSELQENGFYQKWKTRIWKWSSCDVDHHCTIRFLSFFLYWEKDEGENHGVHTDCSWNGKLNAQKACLKYEDFREPQKHKKTTLNYEFHIQTVWVYTFKLVSFWPRILQALCSSLISECMEDDWLRNLALKLN